MTTVETHDAHLRQSDAFAWNMERDPLLRSTIVAVATFDQVPDWERLVDRLERATRLSPNFRRRLVPSPLKLAPPRFLFDPDFELGWHVRRLSAPAPHTLDTVLDFARTAGMAAFDPARPLWECTLIDGLVDGRAALVLKVHHSLTDGIGGIQIAQHIVDLQAEPADLGTHARGCPSRRGRRPGGAGRADRCGRGADVGPHQRGRGRPASTGRSARRRRAGRPAPPRRGRRSGRRRAVDRRVRPPGHQHALAGDDPATTVVALRRSSSAPPPISSGPATPPVAR